MPKKTDPSWFNCSIKILNVSWRLRSQRELQQCDWVNNNDRFVLVQIDWKLKKAIQDTDARLAKRFEVEKAKGTLPDDFPSLERARLLFDLRQGHVFRARAGLEGDNMKLDLDRRVSMVLVVL